MDATGFIKERVDLFKDFTAERIKQLVDGSLVRSFETNEAIAYQGAEATHFGVVLSGTVAASAVSRRHAPTARAVEDRRYIRRSSLDDGQSIARRLHRGDALRGFAHSGIALSINHCRRARRGAAHFPDHG